MIKNSNMINKGWGSEVIWASNDMYCGKFLNFDTGAVSSMHFHAKKHETWYVMSGVFKITTIDTTTSEQTTQMITEGSVIELPPLTPHQLRCIKSGTIVEVSTPDSVEDNYRVMPGDSQNDLRS